MGAAQYLAWEKAQDAKHQLLGGEVFAMAGGSPRHNGLSASVQARLLIAHAGGCATLSSDQKLHIPKTGDFVYPDAAVVCGDAVLHAGTTDVIQNPRVVVEVLSKSTEQHDRGKKWADYQSVPSLTDYLLVSQTSPKIEHFAREADGSWRYRVAEGGESITLTHGEVLAVDDVYRAEVVRLPADE